MLWQCRARVSRGVEFVLHCGGRGACAKGSRLGQVLSPGPECFRLAFVCHAAKDFWGILPATHRGVAPRA